VERPKPKGFWVECITGENFDRNQQEWADHFIGVLTNISAKYSNSREVPQLQDPGLLGQTIKTSMNLSEFQVFMSALSDSLKLAIQARDEQDEYKSSKLWQKILGDEFPLYEEDEEKAAKALVSEVSLASASHALQPTWPDGLGRYKVDIKGFVCFPDTRKVLYGLRNDKGVVRSGYNLKFVARTNVHWPFEVHWQVVNTGKHAEAQNGLRGEFRKSKLPSGAESSNPLENWEHSEYTGKHWIECFIVKDGQLVARSGRFYVKIKNPNF
jgi:hypothetical protein